MNILAIDTVFNKCSVAVVNASLQHADNINKSDNSFTLLCHLEKEGKREQTQQILPLIDEALATSHITLADVSALVFNRGPGAFSGIRINTAVVQALSVACDIPCVGISSLQLVAQAGYEACQKNQQVIDRAYSIIDARMKQVYISEYVCIDGLMQAVEDSTDEPLALTTSIATAPEYLLDYGSLTAKPLPIFALTNDDKDLLITADAQSLMQDIDTNAVILAKLGVDAFRKKQGVSAEKALPVYIRNNAWKTLKEQRKNK